MNNKVFFKAARLFLKSAVILLSCEVCASFTESGLLDPPDEGVRIRSHLKFSFPCPTSSISEKAFKRIHERLTLKEAKIAEEHKKWLDTAHIFDQQTVNHLRRKNFALYSVSLVYVTRETDESGVEVLTTRAKTEDSSSIFMSGRAAPLVSSSITSFKDTPFIKGKRYILEGVDDITKDTLQEDLLGIVGGKKKYPGLFEVPAEFPEHPDFEQATQKLNDLYQQDLSVGDLPTHPVRNATTWEGSFTDSEQILRYRMKHEIKDLLQKIKDNLISSDSGSSSSSVDLKEPFPIHSVLGVMVHVHTMQDPCSICSYSLFKEQHNCQRVLKNVLKNPKNYQATTLLRKIKCAAPLKRNFLGEEILEGLVGLTLDPNFNFLITFGSRRGYEKTLQLRVEKSHWTARDDSSGTHASGPLDFGSTIFSPFLPLHQSVQPQVLKPHIHGKLVGL